MSVLSAQSPAIQQLIVFSEALLLGMLYAFVYDLYRSMRTLFRRPPAVISFIADCVFWVAAAAVTIAFLFYRRWGELHGYTYAGLAGGFLIYFYFFSTYLFPLWQKGFAIILGPLRSLRRDDRVPHEKSGQGGGQFFRNCRIFHFLWRK